MDGRLFEFGLLSFTSLFTMVNPIGVIPLYLSMTAGLTPEQSRRTAAKATLTAAGTLMLFAVAGKLVFDFFAISVHGLRIVGGVIFFLMGYEMLQAQLSRTKHDAETTEEFVRDIAITPLAIPMICGPGAITSVIILMNDGGTLPERGALFVSIVLVAIITYLCLAGAKRIFRFLGDSGNKVLMRIMGLIVMVIGVEFFFSGLKPIVHDMVVAP